MPKQPVNIRLNTDMIAALDNWAATHGTTRTGAIERLIARGLEERTTEEREAPDTPDTPDMREVCDVLRQSNADMREHIAQLYAQLAAKDAQIARAHELADHAQQLHMAELQQKALPSEGIRGRFARWMHRNADVAES